MSELESSTRLKWRRIVDQQRASGLSVAAFCRQHGVDAASLYVWKRRLTYAAGPPEFVEAKIATEPAVRQDAGRIEVCLRGGRRLRVGRGFDPHLLKDVIAVLEGLPSTREGLPSKVEGLR